MKKIIIITIIFICMVGCGIALFSQGRRSASDEISLKAEKTEANIKINKDGKDIVLRFSVPDGFIRVEYDKDSFAEYLRHYPLKKFGSPVKLYDGRKKSNQVHVSVFDMPLLKEDLIQCADAVIKLRAEYLYAQKRYDEISFHITNGMEVPFSRYAKGERVIVKGNNTSWKSGYKEGYDRDVFESYLKFIYSYAGTYSLSVESQKAAIFKLEPGNFFIYGGSPGHVVLVLDVAENPVTKKKIMLLGQSYMPSQEFHVLKSFEDISPWYYVNDEPLSTPEWDFERGSLKKF